MIENPQEPTSQPAAAAAPSRAEAFWGLGLALVACVAVRAWVICHSEVISLDGTFYVRVSKAWSEHPFETVRTMRIHPGYPAAVAAARRVVVAAGGPRDVAGWELSGRGVSLLASVGATVAIWLFASAVFDRRVAWVTVLLVSVGKGWSALGADVLTDALAVCFQAWAAVFVLLALRRLRGAGKGALVLAGASGLCAGVGYLVRPEALVILLAAVVFWLVGGRWFGVRWRAMLAVIAVAVLVAAAVAIPYMILIGSVTAKKAQLEEVLPGLTTGTSLVAARMGLAVIAGLHYAPAREILNEFFQAQHPVLAMLTCVFIGAWAAVGAFRLEKVARMILAPARDGVFLMAASFVLFLPFLVARYYMSSGGVSGRYLTLNALLLSPLAGAAVVTLAGLGRRSVLRWLAGARLSRFCLPAAVAPFLAGMLLHSLAPTHEGKEYLRRAGVFLKGVADDKDAILCDDSRVYHYAEIKGVEWLGHGIAEEWAGKYGPDKPALAQLLRHSNATFLALNDSSARKDFPSLLPVRVSSGSLLAESTPPARRVVGAGKFTPDGELAILWQNTSDGSLELQPPGKPGRLASLEAGWQVAATADFTGDGRSEILARRKSDGRLEVLAFASPSPRRLRVLAETSDLDWRVAAADDFDADSVAEVLWQRRVDGKLKTWCIRGERAEEQEVVLSEGRGPWEIVATGDFNRDGCADVVRRRTFDGALAVWYMKGARELGREEIHRPTGPAWEVATVADIDQDGFVDVLWRRKSDGRLLAWHMAGAACLPDLMPLGEFQQKSRRRSDVLRVYRVEYSAVLAVEKG